METTVNVSTKADFFEAGLLLPLLLMLSSPDTRRTFLPFVLPLDYLEA